MSFGILWLMVLYLQRFQAPEEILGLPAEFLIQSAWDGPENLFSNNFPGDDEAAWAGTTF